MKKILIGLGAFFLLIVVCLAFIIGRLAWKGKGLDESSKAYSEKVILDVIKSWSSENLWLEASPKFQLASAKSEIDRIMALSRERLGDFDHLDGPTGQASMHFDPVKSVETVTANYLGNVSFRKGRAEIRILLVREDEKWKVLGFKINSNEFR